MNCNNYYLFIIHVNEQNKIKLKINYCDCNGQLQALLDWTGSSTLQLCTICEIAYAKTKCAAGYKGR